MNQYFIIQMIYIKVVVSRRIKKTHPSIFLSLSFSFKYLFSLDRTFVIVFRCHLVCRDQQCLVGIVVRYCIMKNGLQQPLSTVEICRICFKEFVLNVDLDSLVSEHYARPLKLDTRPRQPDCPTWTQHLASIIRQ